MTSSSRVPFPRRPLGEVVQAAGGFIKTGPFGSQLHASDYTDDPSGIPVVMPRDMVGGRVNRDHVSRVPEAVAARLDQHRMHEGDVVIARRGDVGRFASIHGDEAGWLCGTGSMRIHAPHHGTLDPWFVGQAMRDPGVRGWLEAQAVGATMPNLNGKIVSALPLPFPAIESQRRVARALGAFDELIEINERRIELLEGLARSLYREWFVRFRFPGSDNAVRGRKPPAGWKLCTLGEMGRWLSGGTPRRSEPAFWGGDIPWFSSGSIRSIVLDEADRYVTAAGAANGTREVPRDTVLLVVRGMSLVNEFRVGIAETAVTFGQDCKAVIANDGVEPLFLAFSVLDRQDEIQGMVELAGHGTGKLSTDRIQSVPIPLPPLAVQQDFTERVRPMRDLMADLMRANRQLATTRDLLLPRLVTGRLDISDVDLGVLEPTQAA